MRSAVGVPLAHVTDPFALEVHRPVRPEDAAPELPKKKRPGVWVWVLTGVGAAVVVGGAVGLDGLPAGLRQDLRALCLI